jgi:hypothetical protein
LRPAFFAAGFGAALARDFFRLFLALGIVVEPFRLNDGR